MREILFRGKRKDNGEWIEGHLLWYEDGRARIIPRHTDIFCYENDENTIQTLAYEVIPETVGQYTVLTDKNGNKIFEGDILKRKLKGFFSFYSPRMKIVFDPIKDCFAAVDIGDGNVTFISDYINNKYELEKIGNIHDNPELVGNSK